MNLFFSIYGKVSIKRTYKYSFPLQNSYYSEEPPSDEYDATKKHPNAQRYQDICIVCGCTGSKRCSKCHKVTYCGKDHQRLDWKAGHKMLCTTDSEQSTVCGNECGSKYFLFPEFEIVTEPESENATNSKVEKSEEEKMREYDNFVKKAEGNFSLLIPRGYITKR